MLLARDAFHAFASSWREDMVRQKAPRQEKEPIQELTIFNSGFNSLAKVMDQLSPKKH